MDEEVVAVLETIGGICGCIGVIEGIIGAAVICASCLMPLVTRDDGKRAKRVLTIGGTTTMIGFVCMLVASILVSIG